MKRQYLLGTELRQRHDIAALIRLEKNLMRSRAIYNNNHPKKSANVSHETRWKSGEWVVGLIWICFTEMAFLIQ